MSFSVIAISSLPNGGALRNSDLIAVQRGTTLVKTTLTGGSFPLFPAVDISAGQILTINNTGAIIPARANSISTSNVIGFAEESVTVASGNPVTFSQIYATIPSASLTIGSYYFVSAATAGAITSVIPSSGNYQIPVGIAVGTQTIFINMGYPTLIS